MSDLSPQIDWIPEGRPAWHEGWMTGYVRGLELILNKLGVAADYDTLLGDCGQAFIVQGEEDSANMVDGAVDVGWWPLEPLGLMRLDFLAKTVGRELIDLILPPLAKELDPQVAYARYLKPVIEASVARGVPCVMRQGSAWYVVTGCDAEPAPLIGMCPNHEVGDEQIYRVAEEPMPPYAAVVVGDEIPRMDRAEADRLALEFAVALVRDQVMGPDAAWLPGSLRHMGRYKETWRTGRRSLSAWAQALQAENAGRWFWHANVKGFLVRNRRTAIRFLEAIRLRHEDAVSQALGEAIEAYEGVIEQAEGIDLSEDVFATEEGRQAAVPQIEAIMALEQQAADALERAVEAMA